MKNLLILSILLTSYPLSIFAQKEVKISVISDTAFTILMHFDDGSQTIYWQNFKSYTPEEIDSLKKNIPVHRAKQVVLRPIQKRDSTINSWLNTPVFDFDAPDTSGFVHRPSQYLGRVLILHFWNFWDSYDLKISELPHLDSLMVRYQKDGLAMLSFVDLSIGETEKRKLAENPLHFPLIPNSRQFFQKYLNTLIRLPSVIIVDKKGNFRHFFVKGEPRKFIKEVDEKKFETVYRRVRFDIENEVKRLLAE